MLYDRRDASISLRELALGSDCSPEGLEAALNCLCGRGHRIQISPDGLARLKQPIALDEGLIQRGLAAGRIGRHVICFGEVGSTNDVAFDSARQADSDGLVVLAESQTSGRGRIGRTWHGEPMSNIMMSVLLLDDRQELHLGALTVAGGVAVAEGIDEYVGLPTRLKWPNDVLLDGKKVSGVLTEARRIAGRQAVVVGMGINVNSCPPPEQVARPATCIASEAGHLVERTELIRAVISRLECWVRQIVQGRGEGLHKAWASRCDMIGTRTTVVCSQRQYTGRVLDISPLDELVLAQDDGQCVTLPAKGSTFLDGKC